MLGSNLSGRLCLDGNASHSNHSDATEPPMVYVPEGEFTMGMDADLARDDLTFLVLLREVVKLLDQPAPPAPAEDCRLCNYRKNFNEAGILE